MNVLFIGDIVGHSGRRIIKAQLANLKKEYAIDVCVANAENAAAGFGITAAVAKDLFSSGVDRITMGNHTFARSDYLTFASSEKRIVRPSNVSPHWPGFDHAIFDGGAKGKLLILNLLGRVNMNPSDSPFLAADRLISKYKEDFDVKMVLLDFHAETTAEKKAMGYYLDGRISLLLGTHTHVQTADEQIFERGTGYITDVGMTGPINSVIGMDIRTSLRRFVDCLRSSYQSAAGPAMMNAVVAQLDPETGKCISIERIIVQEK